jgi:hypothetical protein
MTSPLEIVHHWWEYYRERPFLLLARIFAERIFRGGGDTDAEGLDLGVGLVLTLLALPGGFISVLTFVKYSTFLSWMRGAPQADPLSVALPDELFFITLSMAVTGAIAVWRWDALFPDRRDYVNLVSLPVSTFTIFTANLVAVLFLAVLIAFDVNAASSLLFPLGVAATQSSFLFFVKFAAIHVLVVGLASAFAFFAVLALLGTLVAILPARLSKRISPFVRMLVVMGFVTLLSTSYALSDVLGGPTAAKVGWYSWLPSCWFLGLWESLHGRTIPALATATALSLPGLGLTVAAAFVSYALGYRRYFLRMAEIADAASSVQPRTSASIITWLDERVLRTAFQKGCFHFVWRTLFRSEAHRLALAGIFGTGIVLSSQFLARAVQMKSPMDSAASADALAIPFVLAFFIVVGLRIVFEIPTDLRPNWIFRFTLDREHHESVALARKIMLTFVLPWLALVALPLYVYFDGWLVALLHILLVAIWSLLLANALLIGFRKLPFTCAMPVFQQHSIVTLLGGALAFFLFAIATPQAEARALAEPVWMLAFIPVAALFWYTPRRIHKGAIDVETRLVFEDAPSRAVEVLRLGE